MEKTKAKRTITVFFVLSLVGGLLWFIVIRNFAIVQVQQGYLYASPSKPIILEFQTGNRYDYWELSYRTSGYHNYDYDCVIYKLGRCGFKDYIQYGVPYSYETLQNDQDEALNLKPNHAAYCKNDDIVYIVWDVRDGTVIVDYYSYKIWYRTIKGFYAYLLGSLSFISLLYIISVYKSKQAKIEIQKRENVARYQIRSRLKPNYCGQCGVNINKNANYCPYCGKVYSVPNLEDISQETYDD
jgi:hypothetical protein